MNWIEAIRRWRQLTLQQRREIRLANLPRKVARSMAFDGEPVDQVMLETELARHHKASHHDETHFTAKEQTE